MAKQEELLTLNTLIYLDDVFDNNKRNNVYEAISNFDESKVEFNDLVIDNDEWQGLKKYVEDNKDIYENLYIENIETKNESKKMTLTDKNDNMYIVFQGTSSGYEWNDNGVGAYSNVVQTPSQKNAVDYYDRMVKEYGEGKNIYVSGHSKGGNEAQYVGILRGEQITHVYSFDGQGMNQAVHNKYKEEIEKYSDKITNICNENDFVNILLQPVAGETKYISSNLSPLSLSLGNLMKQHSPMTLFGYSESSGYAGLNSPPIVSMIRPYGGLTVPKTKEITGLGSETSQSGIMEYLSGLFKYYEQHMDEENWQYLCHMIMHVMEMNEDNEHICYSLDKNRFPGEDIDLHNMPDGFVDTVMSLTLGYMEINGTIDNMTAVLGSLNILIFGTSPVGTILGNGFILGLRNKMKDGAAVFNFRVRNFSDSYKEQLLQLVKEVDEEPFWDITKWDIWYRVEDLLGGLNFPENNKELNDYYRKIIDINGESEKSINKIFEDVYRIDAEFTRKLDGVLDKVNAIREQMEQVNNSFV